MLASLSEARFANTIQGEFEAIAYQAFSVSRDTKQATPQVSNGSHSDDIRTAEAELRHGRHLVTQDASRPWLWHFTPITLDMMGQDVVGLPVLEGYTLRRE
jgi:mediator of RNA polymerase II transcription subunit 13